MRSAAQSRSLPQYGAVDAEAHVVPVALDDTAVTGAVATRHRRLPGELRAWSERADGLEHRLRPAREDVAGLVWKELGHEPRLDNDGGTREKACCLGVSIGA